MVSDLVSSHKEIGYEKLKLAVWFGKKENTNDVHILEVVENHPQSFSGYLDTFEFAPSKDFPVRLYLTIAAPADIDEVIRNEDKTLKKMLSSEPEVVFCEGEGEGFWKRIINVG